MSIAAVWALVASPRGASADSLMPVMTPAPQAHCMAETAYSATSAASE